MDALTEFGDVENYAEDKRSVNSTDIKLLEIISLHLFNWIIIADELQKTEIEQFCVRFLSFNESRLVRKTCAQLLKTNFLPSNDKYVEELFVLLSTLEETQFHVVQPVLSKLSILADYIEQTPTSSIQWKHLSQAFILALRHSNGWVRTSTILRVLRLPKRFLSPEFILDDYYPVLFSSYDPYWRIEELTGLTDFLQKLKDLNESIINESTCLKYLNLFRRPFNPSQIFLMSRTLPLSSRGILTSDNLLDVRLLLNDLNYLSFPKLKCDALYSFLRFFFHAFKDINHSDFADLVSMVPDAVQKRLFKEIPDLPVKSPPDEKVVEQPESSSVQQIFDEGLNVLETNTAKAPEALKSLIKLSDEQQRLVAIQSRTAAREAKQSALFPIVVELWIEILLNFRSNANSEIYSKHMEMIFEYAELNPQIAYALSRQLSHQQVIQPEWIDAFVFTATYGIVLRKDDEVVKLAHSIADDFGLDEITDIGRLVVGTRQAAISSIFRHWKNRSFINGCVAALIDKCDEVDKLKNRSFGLSTAHRVKTRLISLLLMILGFERTYCNLESSVLERIKNCAIRSILDPVQQFSIRLPTEWIITLFCIRDQNFFLDWLSRDIEMGEQRIGTIAPWLSIILRSLRCISDIEILSKSLLKILPWGTVQNFSVRVMALTTIRILMNWYPAEISANPSLRFVSQLSNFSVDTSGNSQTVIKSLCVEPFLTLMNPLELDFHTVFYVIPKMCGMPTDEILFENVDMTFIEEIGMPQIRHNAAVYERSNAFSGLLNSQTSVPEALLAEAAAPEPVCGDFEVQQKIDTVAMKLNKQIAEGKELIVVASFIDKPTNLGGLCRTSEVFGVHELVISDSTVLKDRNFQSLSMSAENWLLIREVKITEMVKYIETLRQRGFSVIAAEQTSRSIPLEKFRFPLKSAILLGDEKTGVPPELIRLVDQTVEITQLGQTRSLNVHVSASLFIYQYASQHLL